MTVEQTLIERARAGFQKNSANHVVTQLHRDGDTVRLWRCGSEKTVIHHFYICCPPGWMMVYGDMGEYQWSRTVDMVEFARGSIGSLDYFSEKIAQNCTIKSNNPDLVDEWLDSIREESLEGGRGWTEQHDSALNELKDQWEHSGDVRAFQDAVYVSPIYRDYEDMPNIKTYTYPYLWVVEGINWFISQLDAGNVELPIPESV